MILPNALTMAAGEVREMACGGNYFELRTAAGIVSLIELLDRSGGVVSLLGDAEATDYVRTSRNFEQIRITNGATAQAIKFYYGDGDSGSNRFTGVVSGTVALDAATLAALEYVQVRAESHTGNSNVVSALAANVPELVLAAAGNVAGVIVQSASLSDALVYTGTLTGGLVARATAPALVSDGVMIAQAGVTTANASVIWMGVSLNRDVYVPAGLGLYWIFGLTLSGSSQRTTRYKVLP